MGGKAKAHLHLIATQNQEGNSFYVEEFFRKYQVQCGVQQQDAFLARHMGGRWDSSNPVSIIVHRCLRQAGKVQNYMERINQVVWCPMFRRNILQSEAAILCSSRPSQALFGIAALCRHVRLKGGLRPLYPARSHEDPMEEERDSVFPQDPLEPMEAGGKP